MATLPSAAIARLQALVNADFTADTIVARFSSIANDVSALITYLLEEYGELTTDQGTIASLLAEATANEAFIQADADDADAARIEAQSAAATAQSSATELTPVQLAFLYEDGSDRWQLL